MIFRRVYYQPKQCTTLVQITQNCMYKLALFDFDIPNIGTLRSPVIWHCLRTWVEFSFPPWPAPAPILQHVEWLVHGWKLHQEIVEDRTSRFVEDSLKWLSTVASGAPLQEDSFLSFSFEVGHECRVNIDTNDVGQKVNLKTRTGTLFPGKSCCRDAAGYQLTLKHKVAVGTMSLGTEYPLIISLFQQEARSSLLLGR